MNKKLSRIESFEFLIGEALLNKYLVVEKLGSGWEGEVYKLKEKNTGIELAGKFFYPHRNEKNKVLKFHAKKLFKLRNCDIMIKYFTQDCFSHQGKEVSFLVSEYVNGELLSHFIKRQRGKRMSPFQGLHLLYSLAKGIEPIHHLSEYHGDLHSDNIIVKRHGLGFDLKVVDVHSWDFPKKENLQNDVIDLIHLFHESIGGSKHYKNHPKCIKSIICGLRKDLITEKFRRITHLIKHIETMEWV